MVVCVLLLLGRNSVAEKNRFGGSAHTSTGLSMSGGLRSVRTLTLFSLLFDIWHLAFDIPLAPLILRRGSAQSGDDVRPLGTYVARSLYMSKNLHHRTTTTHAERVKFPLRSWQR